MGESKIKEFKAVEGRAALIAAAQRRSRIRDRFGRGVEPGDVVMLAQANATDIMWRVMQVTPATEPQAQGGYWADVMATTRVLFRPGMSADYVILLVPAQETEPTPDTADTADTPDTAQGPQAPREARSPGGIILSDPDGQSER